MPFPLGRPVLALALIAAATGFALLVRPHRPAADLTVWTFTAVDAAADRAGAGTFADASVGVDLVASAAVDVRLTSLLMAGLSPRADAGRPDVVELEIGSVGKFLRGSPGDVGLRPLGDDLRRGSWLSQIPAAQLAPYSINGVPFGVPLAMHPVVIVYRRDLFDPTTAGTWPQLQAACLQYQRSQTQPRWAMGLSAASADVLLIMLQQRHVTLVDSDGTPHLTDPMVVDTVCWYARAAAGPNRIGTDLNPAPGGKAADLADGTVAAVVAADWDVADVKRAAPELAGRLGVCPLPRFDPTDARSAQWGGTMAAVPRFCPRPDQAWRLVEHLYLSPEAIARRWRMSGALPPVPSAWADPMFHQPDPYFAGQRVAELYVQLSPELPARVQTAYTTAAQAMVAFVMGRCVSRVRSDDHGLELACRGWLADRQAQLQRMVDFDRRTGRL